MDKAKLTQSIIDTTNDAKRGGRAHIEDAALTFAKTATTGYTVQLQLCGQRIDAHVASGASAAVNAAAVADATNRALAKPEE